MINLIKNNILVKSCLVFSLMFISCMGQKVKTLPAKKVRENQYIYHYKRQQDIDTTSFYSFNLLKKDSIKKDKVEKWTKDRVKEFEATLKNFKLNINEKWSLEKAREKNNLTHKLSEYVRQVSQEKALEILSLFAKKVKGKDIEMLVSSVPNLGALDYLIVSGNEITKQKAQDILINKLNDVSDIDFNLYSFYLYDNKTPKYFKTLQNLVAKAQKKNDFEKVIFEYVRVGGVKTVPNLLKWSKKYHHNKIKTAIRILYKYHNIDKNTSAKINSVLKSNHIFYDKNKKDKHLYISDIDVLMKKFKEQGVKINLTDKQRYRIIQSFYKNYSLNMVEVLFNFNLLFVYKANNIGYGHFNYSAGNYEEVMGYYMDVCKNDLPTFSIQTHLKRDKFFNQNYALLLGNETEAFIIKTADKKNRDYDDILMKELFNYVLEVKGIEKKFELLKPSSRSFSQYVFYQKPIIDGVLKELNQEIILDDKGYLYFYK